jgi:Holliday junction DNA helicase RuvB
MEDFEIDVIIGQGPSARTLRLDLPPFTLVGATTRTGLLSAPLLGRFGVVERLDYYTHPELARIVRRSAELLDLEIDETGALAIASRSRGTPRIANRLVRRVRDVAQVRGMRVIDADLARAALDLLEVDALGLEELDRRILRTLALSFEGRPVGLGTLADSVGEASDTIEDVYEPYLLQEGLIARTPRGRVAMPKAFRHLGLEPPAGQALF